MTWIERTGVAWDEAEIRAERGDCLLALGRESEAEEAYVRALAIARRQHAKLAELRAATRLARLWYERDKRSDARSLLAPLCAWFVEADDSPALQEAKRLLEQMH